MRKAHETTEPASTTSVGATPADIDSLRLEVTTPVPYAPQAESTANTNRTSATPTSACRGGGDYQIANRGRLYFRDEFISP